MYGTNNIKHNILFQYFWFSLSRDVIFNPPNLQFLQVKQFYEHSSSLLKPSAPASLINLVRQSSSWRKSNLKS
jgi:hypothetical protein